MIVMNKLPRISSCESCGSEFDVVSSCIICEQPYQYQCSKCHNLVMDPLHTDCVIITPDLEDAQ